MFCFCFFRTFVPIFHFKLCSFYWQGSQDYSLPQGAGYPSYATGCYSHHLLLSRAYLQQGWQFTVWFASTVTVCSNFKPKVRYALKICISSALRWYRTVNLRGTRYGVRTFLTPFPPHPPKKRRKKKRYQYGLL